MANKKFLNPINLVNLASDPSTANDGDIYYNTTADAVKVYANGVWVVIGAGGTGDGSDITVSTTAPSSPVTGDAWYKNNTGEFYVYDGSFWVEVNGVIESNGFTTIAVSGQSNVVADSTGDILTLVAGTNVGITTDATTDSITINSTGNYTSVDSITYPDYITFDTSPETEPTAAGSIWWNPDFETLNVQLDSAVTLQVGQEHVVRVKNDSGSVAIPEMRVVMFAGATGDTVEVTPALSTASYEPELLLGITTEQIPADGFGFVTQLGFINKIDTSTPGWSLGDLLYVDPANAGLLTNVKPSAPNWTFPVAAVTRVHASTGRILVRAIPGKHLHDLVDVAIDSPADNEVLAYNSGNGTWINQTAAEAGLSASDHNHTVDSLSNVVITGTPSDGQALVWDTTTSKWVNETVTQDLSTYALLISPSFTTPSLGVATATSINGTTIPSSKTLVVTTDIGSTVQAYNSTLAAVADGTYSGDDSISTVGTISSGTWNGTEIAISKGGTGKTSSNAAFTNLKQYETSSIGKTLTASSAYQQEFNLGSNGTLVLPNTSTLEIGWAFKVTTGGKVLTVNTSTGTLLASMTDDTLIFTCESKTVNTASAWKISREPDTFTGTGNVFVMSDSPTFEGSISGGSIFTISAGSTSLTIGNTSTVTKTLTLFPGATASGATKTLNIGTGGASGSTTAVNIGSSTSGATNNITLNGTTAVPRINLNGMALIEASSGTSSATSSFNTTEYSSAEYIIYASTASGNYVSKVLMLARGTAEPVITEYAILTQGTAPTVTITPSYSAPNAVLTVAVTSGTNIEIIATEISI
jgi:hypothetical protein